MPVFAGFGGRVRVGNLNLRAHHWSIDWKADSFDVTTFENFGNGGYLPGLLDADITIDAFYDSNDNPFTQPLGILPGNYAVIQIFYVINNAPLSWLFKNVLITSIHSETGVRDVIRYNITAKVSGYDYLVGTEQNRNASPPAV